MVLVAFSEQTCVQTNKTCVLGLKELSWVQYNGIANDDFVAVENATDCIGIWEDQLPRLNTDFDWFVEDYPSPV